MSYYHIPVQSIESGKTVSFNSPLRARLFVLAETQARVTHVERDADPFVFLNPRGKPDVGSFAFKLHFPKRSAIYWHPSPRASASPSPSALARAEEASRRGIQLRTWSYTDLYTLGDRLVQAELMHGYLLHFHDLDVSSVLRRFTTVLALANGPLQVRAVASALNCTIEVALVCALRLVKDGSALLVDGSPVGPSLLVEPTND